MSFVRFFCSLFSKLLSVFVVYKKNYFLQDKLKKSFKRLLKFLPQGVVSFQPCGEKKIKIYFINRGRGYFSNFSHLIEKFGICIVSLFLIFLNISFYIYQLIFII